MKSWAEYFSPVGRLIVAADARGITDVNFGTVPDGAEQRVTPPIEVIFKELDEYFAGRGREFGVALNPAGTEFQRRVWSELRKIPYGQTRTYGQIAAALGNPLAARAVGMANNRNPIAIIVPCHRVVGADGALVGYAGGLERKEILLRLESGEMPISSTRFS